MDGREGDPGSCVLEAAVIFEWTSSGDAGKHAIELRRFLIGYAALSFGLVFREAENFLKFNKENK